MRVTVDEARNGTASASVDLDDVAVERGQIAHAPDGLDRLAVAEDVRVLDHVDLAQRWPAQRRVAARRRRHLDEVADEKSHAVSLRASRGGDRRRLRRRHDDDGAVVVVVAAACVVVGFFTVVAVVAVVLVVVEDACRVALAASPAKRPHAARAAPPIALV